jgi:ribosomal protein S19
LEAKVLKDYTSEKQRLYNIALHQEQGPYSIDKKFQFGLVLKTDSKASVILAEIIGKVFLVYNGRTHQVLLINPEIVNHKFGDFVFTRFSGFSKTKKKKKSKKTK